MPWRPDQTKPTRGISRMDVTNAGRLPQLAAQLVAWRERARVVASFVKEGQCAGTSVGKPRFGGGRLGRIGEAPWDGSGHRYAEMTSQLTAARSRYGAAVEMPFLPRYAENVHRIMRPAALSACIRTISLAISSTFLSSCAFRLCLKAGHRWEPRNSPPSRARCDWEHSIPGVEGLLSITFRNVLHRDA